jgi:pimeloyl-ACP methyl ester carboxylesterase
MIHAEVNGLSVAYERTGDGPALVLLHGFTHDSRVWRPQFEGLADQFTVIAWDAPGAGQSSDPPEEFGIVDWADCLAGVLDAAGVHRADIVGLSWGGLLAQEFYRRHASRVGSLVLADTYAGWKGSLPEPIPQERLAACLRDASLPPSEFVPRYLPSMFSESSRNRPDSMPKFTTSAFRSRSGEAFDDQSGRRPRTLAMPQTRPRWWPTVGCVTIEGSSQCGCIRPGRQIRGLTVRLMR